MKKMFAALLMLGLILCAAGAAAETVSYIERSWDGTKVTATERTANDCTLLSGLTDKTAWSSGWYAVTEDVTVEARITVTGDVHLILKDGATLTAKKGIEVNAGSSLTIYGQSGDTGRIVANIVYDAQGKINGYGSDNGAGIGGGNRKDGGSITIHGGTIDAAGYYGAGIGGGYSSRGGEITILGGTVTATSGSMGAGIGGGGTGDGGSITIHGGHVLAESKGTAGIGGGGTGAGDTGRGGTVTITGGTVEAKGKTNLSESSQQCAIGGGNANVKNQGTLSVSGSKVIMRASRMSNPLGEVFGVSDAGEYLTEHYAYAYIQVDSEGEEDPDDGNQGGGVPGEAAPPAAAGSLPKTGDPSMLGMWALLLSASAAGLKLRKKS